MLGARLAPAAAGRARPAFAACPTRAGPAWILLAEDNPVNQKLAVRLLEKRGHRVPVAGNGREASTRSPRSAFDFVLMDVQMPVLDGFEATAAIRAGEETGGIMPDHRHDRPRHEGRPRRVPGAGMDDYVSKPLKPLDLLKTIELVVERFGRQDA